MKVVCGYGLVGCFKVEYYCFLYNVVKLKCENYDGLLVNMWIINVLC